MYGEMLKAGWADEAKRQTYYDYIHSESERLSRLIENVLQLARLSRNTQRFDLKSVAVAELLDLVRSKVATQVERAGFALTVRNETPGRRNGAVADADCFTQIFINLVDNALKFSAGAANKTVEIALRRGSDGSVLFTVRDFGPGVPKAQMKKIFELFYRAENELTRETVGTGIGLALVRQLALAMRREHRRAQLRAGRRIPPAVAGRHAPLTVSGRREPVDLPAFTPLTALSLRAAPAATVINYRVGHPEDDCSRRRRVAAGLVVFWRHQVHHKKKALALAVLAACGGYAATGSAQTTSNNIEEVLVFGTQGARESTTGSRLDLTVLETPATVDIIDGDAIRARGDLERACRRHAQRRLHDRGELPATAARASAPAASAAKER